MIKTLVLSFLLALSLRAQVQWPPEGWLKGPQHTAEEYQWADEGFPQTEAQVEEGIRSCVEGLRNSDLLTKYTLVEPLQLKGMRYRLRQGLLGRAPDSHGAYLYGFITPFQVVEESLDVHVMSGPLGRATVAKSVVTRTYYMFYHKGHVYQVDEGTFGLTGTFDLKHLLPGPRDPRTPKP